jgi:hypothetical protein
MLSSEPLRTISDSPRWRSPRRSRSRSPGGLAAASTSPTCRSQGVSRSRSTRSNSPITLSLGSAKSSRSTIGSTSREGWLSAQAHSSAAASAGATPVKASTESATISGGIRSARYCSISSSAEASSLGRSLLPESGGPSGTAGVSSSTP